jgi:phosphoribosyl 1,2-cyclic phosphate phosphodiesterase
MPTWELVITGCGTSHGNPPWGRPDQWSDDPRDARRRSGALLRGPQGQCVLIDCGPDLAHQLRDPFRTWDGLCYPRDCITRVDAVLLTHDHADHSHGINDLRHVNRLMAMRTIPIYGHPEHLEVMRQMFPFCFSSGGGELAYVGFRPTLSLVGMPDAQVQVIADLPVTAFAMSHGPAGRTTGFRCGNLAYLTDLKELPRDADALLQGLDLLVLDMLREQPHETHLCWAEAQRIIERLRPTHTVLTHMGHEVRYGEWQARLGTGVSMAVDGLRLPFCVS